MQPKTYTLLFVLVFSTYTFSQPIQKATIDALMITKMAEKYHVKPRLLNDEFSNDVYTTLIKKLDNEKLFFTQDDIKQFEVYRFKIDEEIATQKTNFLQLLITIYNLRLQQLDTMAENILKLPFNFNIPEKYTVQEDTSYPVNISTQRLKVYKKFKYSIALNISELLFDVKEKSRQKHIIDSVQIINRKKTLVQFKRNIQKEIQSVGGITQIICNQYCKTIASCYDPHSEYMTLSDRENFESHLGKKKMIFGFNLDDDDDGNVTINKLAPGSSAFKSGMINKGDKIISIQWEGSQPIDLSNASADEIEEILDANNHTKVILTFLKADGTKRQVELAKEQQTDTNNDNKVKSYLLKGQKTVGYISLPSFYNDWEDKNSINGCSNDVAKEILKLKKENIDGLILDVRYNGGGSVMEAVDLAGIFIDAGPIAQLKLKEPKPITLKDGNRGTIYDGPLTLLVNGFSASASEILAGVFQDYHRALIVGSNTYGKATGQIILPLDTTIILKEYINKEQAETSLKLTISQIYQVSGTTAQFKGVTPDIILPDATDAYENKEKNEPFAIKANNLEANKYYLPNKALPIDLLKEKGNFYQKEEEYFSTVTRFINKRKTNVGKIDISLKIDDIIKIIYKNNEDDTEDEELEFKNDTTNTQIFTVENHKYENERIKSDSNLKDTPDYFKSYLVMDPYIKIAYQLMLLITK